MGRTLRSLGLAAVAASYVQAFAPAALPQVAGIRPSALRAGAAAVSMQEGAPPAVSRRGLLSGALASAVLVAGGSSASADMLKAACTLQSCPEPPSGAYKTDTLQISKGKFTGQGYQFKRPTEDYFKRVQVFDRVTARPGSVLLRDKKNPDTAIFSNVEQIKNADYTWKPTIVEAYQKTFGEKFKLIAEEGPIKTGGVDTYTYEYVVETELGNKFEKVHFVSTFAASAENVYIVNAQAKEGDWANVGDILASCAKSLKVNE